MNTFILQTLILIALAYLFGALLGCWLRKMFAESASILHGARDGMAMAGAGAGAAVAAGTVAARRLAGKEGEASVKISRPEMRREVREEVHVEPRREVVEPEPEPAPVRVAREVRQPERETISYVEPEPVAIVEPTVVKAPVIREEVEYEAPETIPEPAAEPIIDDLTKIKGVGLPIALEMKRIGVTRFEQVARWSDRDVAEVSSKLGFSGRIERENWMAQAKILAEGDDLEFTAHQLRGTERSTRSSQRTVRESRARSDRNDRVQSLKGDRSFTLTSHANKDDLKLITGISPDIEKMLNEIGIDHFSEIAAWSSDEVAAVSRRLDLEDRIERENWVDKARILVIQNS